LTSSIFLRRFLNYRISRFLVQYPKMDPLNTLKKIRKIIKNTTDRELVRLVLDLQKEVFATESHNLELTSELTTLKQQLDLSARMHTRPGSDYYEYSIYNDGVI
jgi:hypothetical protein